MRKSSRALPHGFAAVAESQGEGSERTDPAQPCFAVGAASHPGVLPGGCTSSDCKGQALSSLVQSRLDRPVNLINNGKSRWLVAAAALFVQGVIAVLLRCIQPLARLLPASFLLCFPPCGSLGGGVAFSCQPSPCPQGSLPVAPNSC